MSTCNRTEVYCAVDGSHPRLGNWLEDYQHTGHDLEDCCYELHGPAAVQHVFAVAAGLDSLIIGEPQILGQLKDAYRAAHDAGTAGPMLNKLFQSTFAVAKRVRTETRIGASAVSVASAAVQLARRIFAGFEQHTALLIGAGEMIELVARHLHAQGLKRMIIANRSLNRAQDLALEFKASAITLDALDEHLAEADIVISSTASPVPIVSHAAAKAAIAARRRKPMFMLDIAVPRDIEPEVNFMENIFLYNIDDLQAIADDYLKQRHVEVARCEAIIREKAAGLFTRPATADISPAEQQSAGAA